MLLLAAPELVTPEPITLEPATLEPTEDKVIDLVTLSAVEPTLSDVQSFASFFIHDPESVMIITPTLATIIQPGAITYVDAEASTTLYIEVNGVYNGK
ncbi:hypothetical protein GGI09_002672 [Coemansia sp. S100]|nr:hypothetical protein GGI09_002672 [Coemansia sp. S100]